MHYRHESIKFMQYKFKHIYKVDFNLVFTFVVQCNKSNHTEIRIFQVLLNNDCSQSIL